MPNLSGHSVEMTRSFFRSDATQDHALGAVGVGPDGRTYRYVQAGAVDLVPGNCIQSSAIITTHLGLTAAATAREATSLAVTPGATGGASGLYADGFVGVDTTPGNGHTYGIDGHGAITASTLFAMTLKRDDPNQVALTTASRYGLLASPYKNVIQMPVTTATGLLVGVAAYVILATQWGWIQTKGIGSVLITGTPALGGIVISPSAAAGAAAVSTAVTILTGQIVGRMAQVGVDTKNNFVMIGID